MPGCKVGDLAIIIKLTPETKSFCPDQSGKIVKIARRIPCDVELIWEFETPINDFAKTSFFHPGNSTRLPRIINKGEPIQLAGLPDECLQPIRGDSEGDEDFVVKSRDSNKEKENA